MTLGMRIRNRREELRLTQRELSERAKLSQAYLSQLEQGKFEPTAPTIIRLARSLLLSADELLGMNEKKTEKDERRAV